MSYTSSYIMNFVQNIRGRQRRGKAVAFVCGYNPEESHLYQGQTQPQALCVDVTREGVGILTSFFTTILIADI